MIRVFPRKTKWSPNDALAFFDEPPLFGVPEMPVMVSVTFTQDKRRGKRLWRAWSKRMHRQVVRLGGPAFDDPGGDFVPGRFLHRSITITSRGCPKKCDFCYVPTREGPIRELPIRQGWVVQDNNLLACSKQHIRAVFSMLRQGPMPASFPGGLDIDYLEPWHIDHLKLLQKNHRFAALWVAFDGPAGMKKLNKARDLLADFSQERKFAYVLIGYKGDAHADAESRCEKVYKAGFLPFAMLIDSNTDSEWKTVQRKWARPAIYRSLER
jgi:hypothetical protein